MSKSTRPHSPEIRNKKAAFRYDVVEKFECGLVLVGTEVKSLRTGQASLDEAYARISGDEVWLHNFHIGPYEHGHTTYHEPMRPRKLLLHRREIRKLTPKVVQRGFTLVPLSVYFNERGLVKVRLALARGKTFADKREDLRAKDHQREMQRAARRRA
jgi:SsrA-binding protein